MNTIVCNLNLFTLNYRVYIVDEHNDVKEMKITQPENLSSILVECCYAYNSNKIHLFGPKVFAEELVEEAKSINELKYKEHKNIEFEVN